MSNSIGIKRIDKLFADNFITKSMVVTGKCHICGTRKEIEIVRTSGGYGLNGGLLQEVKQSLITVVCLPCYNSSPKREAPVKAEKAYLLYKFNILAPQFK